MSHRVRKVARHLPVSRLVETATGTDDEKGEDMNETTTTATAALVDPFELANATRLGDLLAAVRLSWDEVFELPEPRPLRSSAA